MKGKKSSQEVYFLSVQIFPDFREAQWAPEALGLRASDFGWETGGSVTSPTVVLNLVSIAGGTKQWESQEQQRQV